MCWNVGYNPPPFQDDLERLRHSAQSEKTQLSTLLGSVQEENRHLKTRLEIIVQSRVGTSDAAGNDDQVRSLLQERKLLEQRLEEAHLHLIDVKSNWSGQNLSLETQVARLSRQVAEETADKRKALKSRDQFLERIKELEKELDRVKVELSQKDNKVSRRSFDLANHSPIITTNSPADSPFKRGTGGHERRFEGDAAQAGAERRGGEEGDCEY